MKRLEWTPNEITLEVDAKEPTTVLVNQNWAAQWRSSLGTVKSVDKLLAVDVPAGKNVLVLQYKDRFLDALPARFARVAPRRRVRPRP